MASAPGRSRAPFLSIPPSRPTRGPPPHARGQVPGTRRPSWSLISLVGVNRGVPGGGVPGGGAPRAELPTRRGCLLSPLKSHCAEIGAFPVAAASPPPQPWHPQHPTARRLPGSRVVPPGPGPRARSGCQCGVTRCGRALRTPFISTGPPASLCGHRRGPHEPACRMGVAFLGPRLHGKLSPGRPPSSRPHAGLWGPHQWPRRPRRGEGPVLGAWGCRWWLEPIGALCPHLPRISTVWPEPPGGPSLTCLNFTIHDLQNSGTGGPQPKRVDVFIHKYGQLEDQVP